MTKYIGYLVFVLTIRERPYMKVDKELIQAILSFLTKNQTVAFLAIPALLLFGAMKFSASSFEGFALYAFIGVSALIFAAWIIATKKK